MKIIKTKFKDLLIVKQKNNYDKRGSLREVFNNKILKVNNFISQKLCLFSFLNKKRNPSGYKN